ncbi:hypothetical protein TWF694_005289 [Orbilia ellipsospora]|uniref:YCII-related domain-containing protein n=1 Tax=Orbilia ellipsospora TaxID=2528407 RepID=A0AAV9WYR5_9PEZI
MPRYILLIRSDEETEKGAMPPKEAIENMTQYYKDLTAAGILVYADGMHASNRGHRIIFPGSGSPPEVEKGPFPANELVCGFWILQTKTEEEALGWAKKCPIAAAPRKCVLELRPFVSMEDVGMENFSEDAKKTQEEGRKMQDEKLGFKG